MSLPASHPKPPPRCEVARSASARVSPPTKKRVTVAGRATRGSHSGSNIGTSSVSTKIPRARPPLKSRVTRPCAVLMDFSSIFRRSSSTSSLIGTSLPRLPHMLPEQGMIQTITGPKRGVLHKPAVENSRKSPRIRGVRQWRRPPLLM